MKGWLFFYCIFSLSSFITPALEAQEKFIITGKVITTDKQPLQNATVSLKDSVSGANLGYAISKADGRFSLQKENIRDGNYLLIVEHVNTLQAVKAIQLKKAVPLQSEIIFILTLVEKQLKEVIIKAAADPFSIRGDTIEFKAKSFKTAETKKLQDLLRNMQGFEVSSDGKINFNGKEVDRILIEGEDLTEKNYQLLSRNLNASLVDKVQVINNYSTNRLLKEVDHSGKIGINLTIDEMFKNKLSGSIEAGSGLGNREYADNNLVWLTRKIKFITFLNFNETGLPANANMQYYFNQDESSGGSASGEQLPRGLLQTGTIYMPGLNQTYTRDNEDIAAFAIGSWKTGKATQMKVLAGADRSRLNNKASGLSEFSPPGDSAWGLITDDEYRSSVTEKLLKFSLSHDRQKNNTGSFTVDILQERSDNKFDNRTGGDVTDTLNEQLIGARWSYRIEGNEAFRLRNGKILKTSLLINQEDLTQDFQAGTKRYQDFFLLDSTFRYFRQDVKGKLSNQEFELGIYSRKGLYNWYSGMRIIHESSSYRGNSNAISPEAQASIELGQAPSYFHSFHASVYGMLSRKVQKKGEVSSGFSLGAGKIRIGQEMRIITMNSPLARAVLGYRYTFSLLKNISVQYSYSSQLPERLLFHPAELISGQATILNPAGDLVNRRNHLLSFSYASHNLLKGTGLVFFSSFSHTDGAYTYSNLLTPEYSLLYYLPQKSGQLLTTNVKLEKYVRRIRTKFTFQISGVFTTNQIIFNNVPSRNIMRNVSFHPKAVTAFLFPVNLEATLTAMYIENSTIPENGESSQFKVWQYQGYGKLKIKAGKKLYMAAMYNYYLLSPKNYFHSMDLYASHAINQAWNFSLTVHNLFNSSTIVQRQFAVNSISEQRYDLVKRYLMVKMQWNF